jgi:hypothetical protein
MILVLTSSVPAQNIEVTITSDKTDYQGYSRSTNDSIIITCKIKNIDTVAVILRMADVYIADYKSKPGYEWGHCFRIYPAKGMVYEEQNSEVRMKDAFVTIKPGEEIQRSGSFKISWLCRGAPPLGDWAFDIIYERNITDEDNYYFIKDDSGNYFKEFFKAWTGNIKSNTITINIKNN